MLRAAAGEELITHVRRVPARRARACREGKKDEDIIAHYRWLI